MALINRVTPLGTWQLPHVFFQDVCLTNMSSLLVSPKLKASAGHTLVFPLVQVAYHRQEDCLLAV